MLLLYYAFYFLLSIVNVFSRQRYARIAKGNKDTLVYSLVTCIVAMGVFYITSGFDINLNFRTLVYGFFYAILVFITYFTSLAVYRYMGIAESSFISSGLSLISTALLSVFVFNETISSKTVAQLILMFLTFLVLFLQNRTAKHETTAKTITTIGIFICLFSALIGCLSSFLSKSFAIDEGVTDENSFFFITNLFIAIFTVIGILITKRFSIRSAVDDFKKIKKESYFMILINVLASNIISLISVALLRLGDLIVVSPLSSAMVLLATEIVAVFCAKEKPRIIATLLAISSVLVVLLF